MVAIEDHALIGDTHCAALVSTAGSIPWLCWPRFDSDACFCALLGSDEHGFWRIAPESATTRTQRRYRSGTMILETQMETSEGAACVIDFMPMRVRVPRLMRCVRGVSGALMMRAELRVRFGYGARKPWLKRHGALVTALAGPDAVVLRADVEHRLENGAIDARFQLRAGEVVCFDLAWYPSHEEPPAPVDALEFLETTERAWQEWSSQCTYRGPHAELVQRSLLTLKALTYSPTGAVVAAPTTSLPEQLGGARNWDYRFCWLRDATFTLLALMDAGYHREALAFRDWLTRAVAGEPEETQIMYGIAGERRLTELELPWLPGYESSRPVRIGNRAAAQVQLDVFGEVMDCLHQARQYARAPYAESWEIQCALMRYVEQRWREPDAGIWETRGPVEHFTHSKVMAWVALDRAIKSATDHHLEAPLAGWRALRREIHDDVCRRGIDSSRGCFTRRYGSPELDASLLMIPLVGFLSAKDPRVARTVAAIEAELVHEGFVYRYDTRRRVDGLPPGEGVFLACSFWLADNYLLLGRKQEAESLFLRLIGRCNDVGLLSEEYDVRSGRLVGNFPQAFSHVALIDTALNLYGGEQRIEQRSDRH